MKKHHGEKPIDLTSHTGDAAAHDVRARRLRVQTSLRAGLTPRRMPLSLQDFWEEGWAK